MEQSTIWDTIVIGSGLGGMTCAASLAKAGQKVLLLEQHYVAGGFTHSFSRKGYHWDVGVHCLGEMDPSRMPARILKWLSNDSIRMETIGPVYDSFSFPDGAHLDLPDQSARLRKNFVDLFPDEIPAIDRYFEQIKEAAHTIKIHFMLRILPRGIERLARKIFFRKLDRLWSKTTQEVLDEITPNQKFKSMLCGQWGYYGSPPSRSSFAIHALSTRHFWNGGYYPTGSASTIAQGILSEFKKNGGEVRTRTSVAEVLIGNGRAVGVLLEKDDEIIHAKTIVSAIGALATVHRILPPAIQQQSWIQSIQKLEPSPCHICLNIGFKGDIKKTGATRHNQWFFETYDMEKTQWDIDDPKAIAPVLYVSYPSLKDSAHEPGEDQRHTGEVVTFVPWSAFEKWKHTRRGKRVPDYHEFKADLERRIVTQMKSHMPDLMELADYWELSTPLSTTFFTRAFKGSIYGLEPTPERFSCDALRPKTPLKGFYLSGADVASLGVVGAMMGGILTASSISRDVRQALKKI